MPYELMVLAVVLFVAVMVLTIYQIKKEPEGDLVMLGESAFAVPYRYYINIKDSENAPVGLISAMRKHEPSLTIMEARSMIHEGTLLHNATAQEADHFGEVVLADCPDLEAVVSCNRFDRTFTLKEWMEMTYVPQTSQA